MADARTRKILKRRGAFKLWGTAAFGAILGAIAEAKFGWNPIAFILNEFQNLVTFAESLSISLPSSGTEGYRLLEFASAPIAGILLGLIVAKVPWTRAWIDRLFPDPPAFLRSDIEGEQNRIKTLPETEPPGFVGREDELATLAAFAARTDAPFLWEMLTGPNGVGKSRLALEWLKRQQSAGWDVGVADPSSPVPEGWRARQPTAIVIDEAVQDWGRTLAPTLARLAEAARPRAPIRVLVIDVIAPNTTEFPEAAPRETVRKARAKETLVLAGLGSEALKALWSRAGGEAVSDEEAASLREETAGRPRAILRLSRTPKGTTLAQALAEVVTLRLPELADEPGDAANRVDRKRMMALALSALAGPLPVASARPAMDGVFEAAPLKTFFAGESLDEILPALKPEDEAQEILLRALAFLDEPECETIARTAFAAEDGSVDRAERVLGSLWADRPEAKLAVAVAHGLVSDFRSPEAKRARALAKLQAMSDAAHPQRVAARRDEATALVSATAEEGVSIEALEAALVRLEQIADRCPADREIRFREAQGARNAIHEYGTAEKFEDLERWGYRLLAVVTNPAFAADREFQLHEAESAKCAATHYGEAKKFEDLEHWGKRLIAVADDSRFAADREIRLTEAKSAVNAIALYGAVGQFEELENWGDRLTTVASDPVFAADREIRLQEVRGAFNAMLDYGADRRFEDLERWSARLIAVASDPVFAADREIRLEETHGAVNATLHYGMAEQFADLEFWGSRLIAIAADPRFAADREIRLEEAKGAYNAMLCYGRVERYDDMERWGARVIAVADDSRFAADREIRLTEAKSAVIAMAYCGEAGLFDDLERWSARLIAVAADPRFVADREIRLGEATGAYNAMKDYGEAGLFNDLERWGARLIAVASDPRFAADPEIRLLEAKDAVNAILSYGNAGLFKDLERWGARLIAVASDPRFAADPEIRLQEAMGAVSALISYGKQGMEYAAARAAWRNRLAAVARAFPVHPGIQEQAKDFGLSYAEQMGVTSASAAALIQKPPPGLD